MITVHHLNNSRSQRVLWLLEELGVIYEVKRYERDKTTMLAPPALKAIHPLGKSPVITEDGRTIAETFNRLYYFERAAETSIRALQTGRPLRRLPDAIAEKTAREWETYPGFAEAHLRELKAILDDEGSDFRH